MAPWFTESVKNKVLLVAGGGVMAAIIAYCVERWVTDEAARAALKAGLDALVVIVVGTLITAVLDHRANQRAAEVQRQRRAAVRAQLLHRLGPSLRLAATGWVHRPGLSAPQADDASVTAGLESLDAAGLKLAAVELEIKQTHELEAVDASIEMTAAWLGRIHGFGSMYWFEGGRPIRFRHLIGIRDALQAELGDASESLRAQFAAFSSALDLAEAAVLKTDAVVQEQLIVATVGETSYGWSKTRENADVARLLGSVAAAAPDDSVLHLTIVADVLGRRALELRAHPPDGWTTTVYGTVNRCIGALEHEAANAQLVLTRLTELVGALLRDDDGRSDRTRHPSARDAPEALDRPAPVASPDR